MLKVRRAYEGKQPDDGIRILVDRLWPRGLPSSRANIDEWAKDIAPSDELRRWFGHQPERWLEFKQKYSEELSSPEKAELVARIVQMAVNGNITLIYSAKDSEHNNARVLEEVAAKHMRNLPRT